MNLRSLLSLALALVTVVLVSGCDDDLVEDATFRMWCGDDKLCAWDVDAGRIRRAPTWHKNDPGVELVETPTAISQLVTKTSRCLVFTMIADVEPSAQVTVGIDFDDDGSIDYEQPIAATGFREAKSIVTAPLRYESFRVIVKKAGTGRAVLAQMRIQSGDSCTAPPVRRHDQPLGTPCAIDGESECASGVCCEGVCAECCVDPKFLDMGPDGGVVPAPVVTCPGGGACERRDVKQVTILFTVVPRQCDPGRRARPPGAVCLADDDCASGACEGASAEGAKLSLGDGGPPCDPPLSDAGQSGCYVTDIHEGRCR